MPDLLDREDWQPGDRAALRMRVPFGQGASHRHDQPDLGCGGLEFLRLPALERPPHRLARILAAEQFEHAIAMMREVRVQPHPAAIAAAIQASDLVPKLLRRLTVDAHVAFAAKFDRGIAHVNTDVLLPSGALTEELGCGERSCPDAR